MVIAYFMKKQEMIKQGFGQMLDLEMKLGKIHEK